MFDTRFNYMSKTEQLKPFCLKIKFIFSTFVTQKNHLWSYF